MSAALLHPRRKLGLTPLGVAESRGFEAGCSSFMGGGGTGRAGSRDRGKVVGGEELAVAANGRADRKE